jgi:cyclopropane fatty-acyl-phospholipid synthase-like methyltransferase
MVQFTPKDVADYYDQTEAQYKMWWKFNDSKGLHYGIWTNETKSLSESILNTNRMLIKMGEIKETDRVLDAGCGVGGTSIFFAKTVGCRVTGITLSDKQTKNATAFAELQSVADKADFLVMDYTQTSFPDNSFDVIVAVESMQSAVYKSAMVKEAYRLLRPGGRLLLADTFNASNVSIDEQKHLKTMFNGWAISEAVSSEQFTTLAKEAGFNKTDHIDVTKEVRPSVWRLLAVGYFGMYGTWFYQIFVRRTSKFSREHHKTCFAQFFAYMKKQWKYELVCYKTNKS